jgi:hypothetical protein
MVAMPKNLKQAQTAIEKIQTLKAEIDDLMQQHGILDRQVELDALKSATVAWAVKTDTESIPLPDGGHAQLRRDKYGGTWVATTADLDGAPPGIVPLYTVLRKKFKKRSRRLEVWKDITKRVVDPERLSAAVEEGVLTLEEVENSYHEKEKAAYLRIYAGDGNG